MDGFEWKTLLKWMIWGYHYFRKHPNVLFIFTPEIGEMIQFDGCIFFQMG